MIRMIAKDLRINPLRTSLTALSMFIGIIAPHRRRSRRHARTRLSGSGQRATGRQVTHL